MKPTFEIPAKDLAVFKRDLERLVAMSSRSATEFINEKSYQMTKLAMSETKEASREQIEALGLRTVKGSERTVISRTGRQRKVRKLVLEKDTAVGNYISALVHQMGQARANEFLRTKFSNAGQIQYAARRWIAKKLRAISFLSSTWRKALRGFSRFGPRTFTRSSPGQDVNVNGYGTPATPGLRPVATIANIVGADHYGSELGAKPRSHLNVAWRKAFYHELRTQGSRLAEKMKAGARSMGVTVR